MGVMPRRHFPSPAGRRNAGQVARSRQATATGREATMTETASGPRDRIVVGNISLSLDGRTAGPGGEYDMGWIVPHALTDGARDHMVKVTSTATTALLVRKNYQGLASLW